MAATALQPPASDPAEFEPSIEPRARRMLVAMAAWTLVYYVAFEPAGYVLATAVYLIGLLSVLNRGRWIVNLAVTLGFTVVSYIVFAKLLGVALPSGVLGV
jgi:putative tricarboxylic transport membrane protein